MKKDRNIELVGLDLVNYLMERFKMDEDEVLNMLSRELGNVKSKSVNCFKVNKSSSSK